VIWHNLTNRQTFIPRLGAKIDKVCINIGSTLIGVKMVDNSVKVISFIDFKLVSEFSGLCNPSKVNSNGRIFTGMVDC